MAVLIKLGDNLVPVNSLIIGGKEPNLQEKNVDITSNGTSEVLPDGEYTGLSKVNINANVPDSIPYIKAMIDGSEYVGDIVIPNNITEIMPYAFYGRSNLKGGLTLSDNLTSIKDYAFFRCTGLTSIEIPDSVNHLGDSTFKGCNNLSGTLIIPSNVTTLDNSVFQECTNLTGLVLNEGLQKIGSTAYYGYTFEKCWNIAGEVIIPSTVWSISSNIFEGCKKIEKFTYKAQVTSIPRGLFYGCIGCKTFKCETAITDIGQQTFYNCNAMELYDFRNCTVVPTLADTTLGHKDGCQIVVPDALYDEWIAATNWSSLTNVVFVKASEYVEV